jgi:hypothetical protein
VELPVELPEEPAAAPDDEVVPTGGPKPSGEPLVAPHASSANTPLQAPVAIQHAIPSRIVLMTRSFDLVIGANNNGGNKMLQ